MKGAISGQDDVVKALGTFWGAWKQSTSYNEYTFSRSTAGILCVLVEILNAFRVRLANSWRFVCRI